MERTVRTQRTLSKQEEIDEGDELESYDICGNKSSSSEVNNTSTGEDQVHPTSNSPLNNNNSVNNNNNNNVLHRSRSQSKVKLLVRSHAVREETSPPPDPPLSPQPSAISNTGGSNVLNCNNNSGNGSCGSSSASVMSSSSNIANNNNNNCNSQQQPTNTTPGLRVRHKLRREGSSQGSTDSWEPTLSRGNSREQYDSSNTVDLQQFIAETLNRNYKDRLLLLKIESELLNLAKDPKKAFHKFAQMSSYQRMLVHRVAAYFGMEHNVDPTGSSVIVNITKATRVPDRRFRDFVREDLLLPEEPRRSILKRDSSSFDETGCFKSGDRMLNGDSRRSKSFEEREEEYEKVRRRIFNREHSIDGGEVECLDELHWEGDGICSQCEQSGRVHSHSNSIERNVRLLKVESYESSDTLRANSLRLSVSKSHSFNGYDPPQNARVLTKQDSGSSMSSRISPSSSGYKSQRSDATLSATPSPTATPNLHTQLSSQSGAMSPDPDTPVVWAVTDMASVPPGSMLIHPQTGQPYTNPDGTIYHFDPANPPRVSNDSSVQQHNSTQQLQTKSSDCVENEVSGASNSGSSQEKSQSLQQYDSNHQPQPPEPRVCTTCVAVGSTPQGFLANTNQGGGNLSGQSGLGGVMGAPTVNYPAGVVPPAPIPPPVPPAPPIPPTPYPAHHQYSVLLPPAHHPSAEPTQYHPAPAVVCPAYIPHQYPEPRIPGVVGWQDGTPAVNDLTSYMMGINLDGTRTAPPPADARPTPATALYWSHHLQGQNTGQAVPVYYAGSGGQSGNTRYQSAPQPPPPPPPSFPHPSQLVPPPPQPPPQQHPADHSGACYGPGYASSGPECIPYAPPTALHMYYSTAPCNNGSQQTSSQTNGYYNGGVNACGAPLVTLQYQQPCAHPAPTHAPQGVCGQFAVYNSCYPGHYAPPASSLPVAQLFRKPALQVGVRCNSPLRPPYPGSPTIKERGIMDKQAPPPPPLQQSLPVYGIRVVPGDMRLLGNAGRLPFALPVTKATHPRKHRSKGGAASASNSGISAGASSGTRVAQQREALSMAIEVVGHHHHRQHNNNNNNAATAKA